MIMVMLQQSNRSIRGDWSGEILFTLLLVRLLKVEAEKCMRVMLCQARGKLSGLLSTYLWGPLAGSCGVTLLVMCHKTAASSATCIVKLASPSMVA
jgi:hypothetical protein